MLESPKKSTAIIWAGDPIDEEDEVFDPFTGALEGQCPRCFVWALEGNRIDGLGCCYCNWDSDKRPKGVSQADNGRKVCGTCRWFARATSGDGGACLSQHDTSGSASRWCHPTVDEHHQCDGWRLIPRRRWRKPKAP